MAWAMGLRQVLPVQTKRRWTSGELEGLPLGIGARYWG